MTDLNPCVSAKFFKKIIAKSLFLLDLKIYFFNIRRFAIQNVIHFAIHFGGEIGQLPN